MTALAVGLFASGAIAQDVPYEIPERFPAAAVLPPDMVRGEHFEVLGDVVVQGFSNNYILRTDFETGGVTSQDMLAKRIHEAAAIAEIRKVKQDKAFTAGMANALKSPYKAVKALVTDPVDTLMGIPEGAWKLAKRLGEMISGSRGEREDSVAAEIVGFSTVKRKLAFKLGVDVYSSNRLLQQEMNDVAFAGFAGGFAVNLALGAVTMPSGLAQTLNAAEFAQTANRIITDSAPEDLRIRNRDSMLAMGAGEEEIKDFLNNDVYTPRHETIITLALEGMDGVENRAGVVRLAKNAERLMDAQLMQRTVEMMRSYHALVEPAVAIEEIGGRPVLRTAEGKLVMVLPADRLHWTEVSDQASSALADFEGEGITAREIVVAGSVSERAEQALIRRGIKVTTGTRDQLLPVEEWTPPELEVEETAETDEAAPPAEDGDQSADEPDPAPPAEPN